MNEHTPLLNFNNPIRNKLPSRVRTTTLFCEGPEIRQNDFHEGPEIRQNDVTANDQRRENFARQSLQRQCTTPAARASRSTHRHRIG